MSPYKRIVCVCGCIWERGNPRKSLILFIQTGKDLTHPLNLTVLGDLQRHTGGETHTLTHTNTHMHRLRNRHTHAQTHVCHVAGVTSRIPFFLEQQAGRAAASARTHTHKCTFNTLWMQRTHRHTRDVKQREANPGRAEVCRERERLKGSNHGSKQLRKVLFKLVKSFLKLSNQDQAAGLCWATRDFVSGWALTAASHGCNNTEKKWMCYFSSCKLQLWRPVVWEHEASQGSRRSELDPALWESFCSDLPKTNMSLSAERGTPL